MVFDAIYDEYEKRIIEEFKHSKSEEEIEDMLEAKEIHDIILKRFAKALAVAVYRNGKIEDIMGQEKPNQKEQIKFKVCSAFSICTRAAR